VRKKSANHGEGKRVLYLLTKKKGRAFCPTSALWSQGWQPKGRPFGNTKGKKIVDENKCLGGN